MTRWIASLVWGVLLGVAAPLHGAEGRSSLPDGWTVRSIPHVQQPTFSAVDSNRSAGSPDLCITGGDSPGLHGWLEQSVPVVGGNYYRFSVARQVERIASPRRCTPVRIRWTGDDGKMVPADIPPGHEDDPGYPPLAEPEHPLDSPATTDGWTDVSGVYRAPSTATRAVLELHLQWAPGGRVVWRGPELVKTDPPPPREVRLAAVHYTPRGSSPQHNCEEFAPLIAAAAERQADLVVLGETVPYVGVGKSPYETAEIVPGPTTEFFGALARQHRLHLVLSLYESESGVVYNTAVLLGPDGGLIGKYRKVCLPHSEIAAGVTPGTEYPVFDTAFGKVGLMVCYDGFFPEVARELSNRGAEVIAWPVWGCNPLLARARACENHVFLISSTYSQGRDWITTAVFDRAGRPLVEADAAGQVVVATVDLSRPHFWKNNLGDFRSMIPRHRP